MRVESYAPGSFCWAELATSDAAAAAGFYGEMFGWNTEEHLMPMGIYVLFRCGDNDVAGMFQAPPGVPVNWGPHFSVVSADDAAAKALSLGGKVVAGPLDAHEAGRMAVVQDPQGATFTLWQAKRNIGATHGGPLNMFCWPELATREPAEAADFYSGLFGWTTRPGPDSEIVEYAELYNGDRPFGGILAMRGGIWKGIPPHWTLYVTVADCNEGAAKAKLLGGEICVPPQDIPKVGRFSVISDPQGAKFAIIQMTHR
jgi:uncharacterized protein